MQKRFCVHMHTPKAIRGCVKSIRNAQRIASEMAKCNRQKKLQKRAKRNDVEQIEANGKVKRK